MSRKTSEFTVGTEGRDKGKKFLLTEMGVADAEAWGYQALSVMLKSGMDVPADAMLGGMAVAATYGVKAFLAGPYAEVGPLLERLLACVQIIEPAVTRPLFHDDVEEIETRVRLRDEVIRLHVNFSPIDRLLEMATIIMAQKLASLGGSSQTSPDLSEPSSEAARPRSKSAKSSTRSKTPTTS